VGHQVTPRARRTLEKGLSSPGSVGLGIRAGALCSQSAMMAMKPWCSCVAQVGRGTTWSGVGQVWLSHTGADMEGTGAFGGCLGRSSHSGPM
jgi:hypothetical protein